MIFDKLFKNHNIKNVFLALCMFSASMLVRAIVSIEDINTGKVKLDQINIDELVRRTDSNDADAMYILSVCYSSGRCGEERSQQKERYWIEKAVALNQPDALYRLGSNYQYGKNGFELDLDKATRYYESAAKQNHGHSIFSLISILVARENLNTGIINRINGLFNQAVKLDKAQTYEFMVDSYWTAINSYKYPVDNLTSHIEQLTEWHKKSIQAGVANSCGKIANLYFTEDYIVKDEALAYAWYSYCKSIGDKSYQTISRSDVSSLPEDMQKSVLQKAEWLKNNFPNVY